MQNSSQKRRPETPPVNKMQKWRFCDTNQYVGPLAEYLAFCQDLKGKETLALHSSYHWKAHAEAGTLDNVKLDNVIALANSGPVQLQKPVKISNIYSIQKAVSVYLYIYI